MELKTGYKQTEVGVIPSDWEVKILHSLSEKIMVGIASSATHAYRENGIIMFRNQNIKPNLLDDTDILYIAPEYEAIFKNKRLKAGDLLTARTGYPGTTCLVPVNYEGAQSFTTLISRVRDNLVNSKYLCFYLNSEKGQLFFEQNQIGGGQKNVNAGTLKLMPIPLPPTKVEQAAIATALTDTYQYIAHLEKLISKKRNIKQGAMQELLRPKEGWVVKKLGELGEFKNGINKGEDDFGFGFPFVNLMDVFGRNKVVLGSSLGLVNTSAIERKTYELKRGDVLFIRSSVKPSGVGLTSLVNEDLKDTVYSGFLIRFRDFGELDFDFKTHCFNESGFRNRLIDSSTVSANTNINQNALKQLTIALPPKKAEQTRIATILSDMDSEITTLETKLTKAQSIKQGMMQQLLTGKIRLI